MAKRKGKLQPGACLSHFDEDQKTCLGCFIAKECDKSTKKRIEKERQVASDSISDSIEESVKKVEGSFLEHVVNFLSTQMEAKTREHHEKSWVFTFEAKSGIICSLHSLIQNPNDMLATRNDSIADLDEDSSIRWEVVDEKDAEDFVKEIVELCK